MSSAPPVSTPTNNTSANITTQTATQGNGFPRSTMRTNNQAKNNERKQSPGESGPRTGRPAASKAWASGTNPITQRNSSSPQSNGVTTPSKGSGTPKMATQKEATISDRHAHDRLLFVLGASIGLNVVITSKTGEKFEGILAGSTLLGGSSKFTTKMTRKIQGDAATMNGVVPQEAAFIGSSPEYTTTFDMRDVSDVQIPEFSVPESSKMSNGTHTKFQTDADISGNRLRGERKLERWVPDESDDPTLSLGAGSVGDWDQFAANKQLTGKDSTYEEGLYTTHINRDAADYRVKAAYAEMKKREIEGSASTNVHVREERGQHVENEEDDEESKYSGVRRNEMSGSQLAVGGPNKYTPPARRAPTGQPTVPGAPVDSAILSAQIAQPDRAGSGSSQLPTAPITATNVEGTIDTEDSKRLSEKSEGTNTSAASAQKEVQNQTEGVENKVLQVFRQFADSEKQKVFERKRAQASQDRTIKLNELRRFAKDFKLNSEVPSDLVGILAKDPMKQEAIIKKAKQDLEESSTPRGSGSGLDLSDKGGRKGDLAQLPGIPERPLLGRGRGGYPQGPTRAQQQNGFAGRNAAIPARPGGQQDRKPSQPHAIPAPIPILDGRVPPTGPMADQPGLASPQRSNLQTPTSATSPSRLNVRASEFRPNAAAPAFNPAGSSNAPSSPSSTQRAASVSRAATPSTFFRSRKPKSSTERPSISSSFNTIEKLKSEVVQRLAGEKASKPDGDSGPPKDYASNGGIPNAFQTAPRWTVRMENEEKTYLAAFERTNVPMMQPTPSRSGSSHHVPYQQHMGHIPSGPSNIPQISTPQHMHHGGPQHFAHQFEEGQRMQMNMGHTYSSPSIPTRQPSTFASPMINPAQLAYGQPYFGAGNAQVPMQMRQYPGTPGMMHPQPGQVSAPIMVQQQSTGPYMQMPQQFGQQMPMYSPNPGHAYPQQNGYGSPSRAPMMMQQGSQQGQPMMYTMSSQGQMGYPQQAQMNMMRGGYGGHQYGSSPQQPYPMPQRAMSSGYGQIPQKMMHGQSNQGPPMNAPQQPAAYGQMAMGQEEGK